MRRLFQKPNQLTIKEEISELQKQFNSEKDFLKKMELGDRLIDLKRKAGYLTPPKPGEDCLNCSA